MDLPKGFAVSELQGVPPAAAHPGGSCGRAARPAAARGPRASLYPPRTSGAPRALFGSKDRAAIASLGDGTENVPVRRWRSPAVFGRGGGRGFLKLALRARSPSCVWSSAARILLVCQEQVPACGDQRAVL